MSKENVALFIKAVNKRDDLSQQIARTDKTTDWVQIARTAGFEFTEDEFALVVSDITGKQVSADRAVLEYMAASNEASSEELQQKALESAVGGLLGPPRVILLPPGFIRGSG